MTPRAEFALKLLRAGTHTDTDVARAVGLTRERIRQLRGLHGIPLNRTARRALVRASHGITPTVIAHVVARAHEGRSLAQICREVGMVDSTAKRILAEHGVTPVRGRGGPPLNAVHAALMERADWTWCDKCLAAEFAATWYNDVSRMRKRRRELYGIPTPPSPKPGRKCRPECIREVRHCAGAGRGPIDWQLCNICVGDALGISRHSAAQLRVAARKAGRAQPAPKRNLPCRPGCLRRNRWGLAVATYNFRERAQ